MPLSREAVCRFFLNYAAGCFTSVPARNSGIASHMPNSGGGGSLRGAQLGNQAGIGCRKREVVEILRYNPAQISDIERPCLAFEDGAIEEMESNRLGGIVVVDGEEFIIHADFYSEFFPDFPLKRDFQGLAGVDFSAGKFPEPGQVDVVEPLRDQDLTVLPDDGRDDINPHES